MRMLTVYILYICVLCCQSNVTYYDLLYARTQARDPFGDGDQSPIKTERQRNVVQSLWATGADVDTAFMNGGSGMTPFGRHCITANKTSVEAMLKAALKESPEALVQLIERRETVLRLSPLMLVLTGQPRINSPFMQLDHLGTLAVLLRYGARPTAKCVCGKTVVHYGAGIMANPTTLEMVSLCIAASKAGPPPGTEVVLAGLSKESLNGRLGIVRGYIAESGRRVVAFPDGNELAIKPANVSIAAQGPVSSGGAAGADGGGSNGGGAGGGTAPTSTGTPLVDMQDRFGEVSLHSVLAGNRGDVTKFLAETHGAAVDIQDADGVDAESQAKTLAMGSPDACAVLSRIIAR